MIVVWNATFPYHIFGNPSPPTFNVRQYGPLERELRNSSASTRGLHMSNLQKSLSFYPPRPTSAPPPAAKPLPGSSPPYSTSHVPIRPSPLVSNVQVNGRSILQGSGVASSSSTLQVAVGRGGKGKGRVLGIQERLKAEIDGVVKRRAGGVLARG